jgi:SAM-dependent methyltransferase
MRNNISKLFINISDSLSSVLLDDPTIFNFVRYLLAGRQKRMKKFIKKYLDEYDCKTIADICSGTGDFAELIAIDAKYIGFDLNSDFVNYAKNRYKNHKNKKFLIQNVLKLKNDEKFDAVMLISTVHHFSDEELKIILPKVKQMTKKVVIIADIIPDAPHLLQRFFAKIDRGKYVRPAKEKIKILEKYFKVTATQNVPTRTAVQFGIICEKK